RRAVGSHGLLVSHFLFSSRRRHTRSKRDWSSDVCSSDLFRSLAAIRNHSPGSKEVQEGMKEWYQLLNKMGNYSLEAFKGLGKMYVVDERFTKNIDEFGEGLAIFMRDAMAFYADNNEK